MPASTDKRPWRSGLEGDESTVRHLMSQARQRQQEKKTKGRGKPGHAGRVGKDQAGRSKATYNSPVDRQNQVREMAEAEDVSQADIVEAAVTAFYNAWQAGQVDLEELKWPAKSVRVMWRLEVPDDFSLFSG